MVFPLCLKRFLPAKPPARTWSLGSGCDRRSSHLLCGKKKQIEKKKRLVYQLNRFQLQYSVSVPLDPCAESGRYRHLLFTREASTTSGSSVTIISYPGLTSSHTSHSSLLSSPRSSSPSSIGVHWTPRGHRRDKTTCLCCTDESPGQCRRRHHRRGCETWLKSR